MGMRGRRTLASVVAGTALMLGGSVMVAVDSSAGPIRVPNLRDANKPRQPGIQQQKFRIQLKADPTRCAMRPDGNAAIGLGRCDVPNKRAVKQQFWFVRDGDGYLIRANTGVELADFDFGYCLGNGPVPAAAPCVSLTPQQRRWYVVDDMLTAIGSDGTRRFVTISYATERGFHFTMQATPNSSSHFKLRLNDEPRRKCHRKFGCEFKDEVWVNSTSG